MFHPILWNPAEESLNLGNRDKLCLKDEGCVCRDHVSSAAGAVAELGGDGELALLADLHAEEALVPALDDLAGTDDEVEGAATIVARVELLAIGQGATVVDVDAVAW
jgi:hypothetical protein